MEALALHTGAPTIHWEDNTSFISVYEAKIVTPIVKHIDIPVCFLQDKFDNGLFLPKYEKSKCHAGRYVHQIVFRSNNWPEY